MKKYLIISLASLISIGCGGTAQPTTTVTTTNANRAANAPVVQSSNTAPVQSAGNQGVKPSTGLPGFGGINSPGNAPSAITVGSVRDQATNTRTDDLVADSVVLIDEQRADYM